MEMQLLDRIMVLDSQISIEELEDYKSLRAVSQEMVKSMIRNGQMEVGKEGRIGDSLK